MREPILRTEEPAMNQQPDQPGGATPNPARRSFLKAAPLGALAAVAAGGAEAKPEQAATLDAKPEVKRGYHETDHIRRYYQTAAYW